MPNESNGTSVGTRGEKILISVLTALLVSAVVGIWNGVIGYVELRRDVSKLQVSDIHATSILRDLRIEYEGHINWGKQWTLDMERRVGSCDARILENQREIKQLIRSSP